MNARIAASLSVGVFCLIAAAMVDASPENKRTPSIENIPGQTTQARRHVARMSGLVVETLDTLERARRQHQAGAINCTKAALIPMQALLRLSEGGYQQLIEAASRHDATAVEHAYIKIAIALYKIEDLYGQTKGCTTL